MSIQGTCFSCTKLAAFLADNSQCRRVRLLQHFGEEPQRLNSEPQEPRKGESRFPSSTLLPFFFLGSLFKAEEQEKGYPYYGT